jgi:ABC-2 type transport system permease protein
VTKHAAVRCHGRHTHCPYLAEFAPFYRNVDVGTVAQASFSMMTLGLPVLVLFLALGMLATLPIGMIIGAVVPSTQKVGTWGMLPVMVLAATSGIFYPVQELWGWVQGVVQVFPMYWIGLGMRSAFLPDAAAALELGQSWRPLPTIAVLAAWAVAGTSIAPVVLRRMARRQSGAAVLAARDAAAQWVR